MSKESGLKIVPTGKALRTCEGSLSQAFLVDILASKTTDEAVAKIRPLNDKPWDVVRSAVARGYITLVTTDGKPHSRDKRTAKPATKQAKQRPAVSKAAFVDLKPTKGKAAAKSAKAPAKLPKMPAIRAAKPAAFQEQVL